MKTNSRHRNNKNNNTYTGRIHRIHAQKADETKNLE